MTYDEFTHDIANIDSSSEIVLTEYFSKDQGFTFFYDNIMNGSGLTFFKNFTLHSLRMGIDVNVFFVLKSFYPSGKLYNDLARSKLNRMRISPYIVREGFTGLYGLNGFDNVSLLSEQARIEKMYKCVCAALKENETNIIIMEESIVPDFMHRLMNIEELVLKKPIVWEYRV